MEGVGMLKQRKVCKVKMGLLYGKRRLKSVGVLR